MQVSPLMIAIAGLIGLISAIFAYRTDRNPYLWFCIGFFFGIFGVFAIFFASKKATPKQPAPSFTIGGPTDKFCYYLDPTSQQIGPMSYDALSKTWKEGKIDLSTYIWHEELKEWTPLKETLLEN